MDQDQPTSAQIVEMLREQQARVDEQQRRLAQLEGENAGLKDNAQRVEAELKADNAELKAENAELKATTQRLDAELERQRLEKLSLASRVNEVEGGPGPQDRKLSRAGLFKAAAMGSAAAVGAQALGTLGAEKAGATTTDTNFIATGSGPYGYETSGTFTSGGFFVGQSTGAQAFGNTTGSTGMYASGNRYGGWLTGGNGVQLYLEPGSATGSPTTGAHYLGEISVDTTGRIYHCVIAGTPGTWVPLNTLVPIPPVRVLDTRSGTLIGPYPTGNILNLTLAGQTYPTSSGTFTFPSNIIGVVGNLVAVTPTGAGYLVAYPQGATLPTAASVNFVPPGTGADVYYSLGNHVTVALSAVGQMSIYIGMVAGARVHVVLDIAGYLV